MTKGNLPQEVLSVTSRWLDAVEAALHRIANAAMTSQTSEGLVVASVVEDAFLATTHFRRVLARELPLGERPQVRYVRITPLPESLARVIADDLAISTSLPEDLLDLAKRQLPLKDVAPFLLLIGHVAGSQALVAAAVWDSYPHLAPPGWVPSDAPKR